MKKSLSLITSTFLLMGCAQKLDSRKVRPGEILGTRGLETTEIQKLVEEVNAQAPLVSIPKDGDSLTTRITFHNKTISEFTSTQIADFKCRFEYDEILNTDTITVSVIGDVTKYERTRKKVPVTPTYIGVPLIESQKDACENEIELLNTEVTNDVDFSSDRKIFNEFFNNTFLKSLENCKGQNQSDDVRCLSATFVRAENNQDAAVPTYSMTINQGSVNANLDRVPYELFLEVSPRMTYFFPYGVFNLKGKLFSAMTKEFQGIKAIQFESINF